MTELVYVTHLKCVARAGLRVRVSPGAFSLLDMKSIQIAQAAFNSVCECPRCGDTAFKIIESRLSGSHRRRRKRCETCNYAHTTYEVSQEYFFEAQSNAKLISDLKKQLSLSGETEILDSGPDCSECINMTSRGCSFEFPEAGSSFASECIQYENIYV